MAFRAFTPEQKQILIGDFARRAVRDIGDAEIDVRALARTLSVTLRHQGFLNAYIDPEDLARECAKARESKNV